MKLSIGVSLISADSADRGLFVDSPLIKQSLRKFVKKTIRCTCRTGALAIALGLASDANDQSLAGGGLEGGK
jgi:hypothetical protein